MARRLTALSLLLALVTFAGSGCAQERNLPSRDAPPQPPHAGPPRTETTPPGGRLGGGPTGNDTAERPPGVARGVVPPPLEVDPGIHAPVPNPTPGTTRVIPPPGSPGGDPRIDPR